MVRRIAAYWNTSGGDVSLKVLRSVVRVVDAVQSGTAFFVEVSMVHLIRVLLEARISQDVVPPVLSFDVVAVASRRGS